LEASCLIGTLISDTLHSASCDVIRKVPIGKCQSWDIIRLLVERGSVRFGGVAERPEIREDRGLGQREREKHARKLELWEVVVVLIVVVRRTRVSRKEEAMYKQFNHETLTKPLNLSVQWRVVT
jgi:hypothetical protein